MRVCGTVGSGEAGGVDCLYGDESRYRAGSEEVVVVY